MLNIQLRGDQALMAKLESGRDSVRRELKTTITKLILELERKIKAKLSGPVLNVRSGDLRRSISAVLPVSETASGVQGKVIQSGDVKYGAIHEFGGKTAAHDIYPKKGEALKFMFQGKESFFKVVHHPGSVIPERSYMRSSLAEMRSEIVREMTAAVKRGMALR